MTDIIDEGFKDCTELTEITIPASVRFFGENVFANHNDNLTIYGYKNSEAEKYAKDNNIRFVALNDDGSKPVTTTAKATTTAKTTTTKATTTSKSNSPKTGDSGAAGIAAIGMAAALLSAAAYKKRKD